MVLSEENTGELLILVHKQVHSFIRRSISSHKLHADCSQVPTRNHGSIGSVSPGTPDQYGDMKTATVLYPGRLTLFYTYFSGWWEACIKPE